jgi:hypothetical protein
MHLLMDLGIGRYTCMRRGMNKGGTSIRRRITMLIMTAIVALTMSLGGAGDGQQGRA